MTQGPRPPRMYSDAERDALRRELWDVSHWIDWVESGARRETRLARLADVPPWALADVTRKCQRRAARALGRTMTEEAR